jgi:hypothetical protein
MLKLLTFAVALSCLAGSASAGWCDVGNFKGVVGSKSVHLSIQRYERKHGLLVGESQEFKYRLLVHFQNSGFASL